MQVITSEHAEQWAARFEKYDRTKVFALLDSSIAANAPKWTPRRRMAEEMLLLVQLPTELPSLLKGRVRALKVALQLAEWVNDWASTKVPANQPSRRPALAVVHGRAS